jgi:hypothetical protein
MENRFSDGDKNICIFSIAPTSTTASACGRTSSCCKKGAALILAKHR